MSVGAAPALWHPAQKEAGHLTPLTQDLPGPAGIPIPALQTRLATEEQPVSAGFCGFAGIIYKLKYLLLLPFYTLFQRTSVTDCC
jgi:hypothetical protein